LLWLLKRSTSVFQSFFIGWGFGVGYFLSGLYWISYALLVDSNLFGWLIPFAVIIIPASLGLYIGILTLILHRFRNQDTKLVLLLSTLWVIFEIIRTSLFTGFPWLALGYSLTNHLTIIQSASLFGVFGLSFLVILISLIPFVIFSNFGKTKLHKIYYLIISTLLLIANWSYGEWRLKNSDIETLTYSVRIVQPNISQSIKWSEDHRQAHLKKLMDMSRGAEQTYIIWPEAAVPYSLNSKEVRNFIKTIIPENSYLITGGIRESYSPILQYWTSLFILDHRGDIVDHYDKTHLVPFGEYIPMRGLIPSSLRKITHGLMDYSKGEESNKILKPSPELPSFRGLICYESFFPQEIITKDQDPDFLLNITNDAWYGESPGPYQHFDIARFRSIEFGLPSIRVANTGISAVISAKGEILQQIGLNHEGIIIANIPQKNKKKTLYHLYGMKGKVVFFAIILFGTLCF